MNKLKIVSILKVFYYMLPKFIRVQYSDSVTVLRNMALGDKSLHNDFFVENKIKLVKELESLGATFDIITHIIGRKNIIGAPAIYIDNVRCFRPSLEGGLLDVKVIHLFHVTLIGSTDGVIYKDKMYHQELLSMRHTNDLKQPDIFVSQNFVKIHNYDYLVRSRKNVLNIEGPAISLLKEHSSNYYHCVTEILPKLQQILSCVPSNKDSFSILIDDCMPIQVVNMINVILSAYTCFQYELIKVEKGQKVNCNEVIYCTPLWLSLDNTQYLPDPKNEFFVSVDSLKKLKGHISSVLFAPTVSSKYRKVYLQRQNNRLRKISNILEVERVLYKHGFEFVNTGTLSFQEQYELFSDTDVVIGVSGASFTNILFMQRNSKAILLSPSAQCTNYYIFQPLADVSEVELVHLLSKPDDDSNSLHGDASVNVEELELFLSEMSCDIYR